MFPTISKTRPSDTVNVCRMLCAVDARDGNGSSYPRMLFDQQRFLNTIIPSIAKWIRVYDVRAVARV